MQKQKRLLVAAGLLATLSAALVLRFFDPERSAVFPPCPLHFLTGLYCPGCGSLRALHQLLQGHLATAWAMNPLTIILLPFIGYGLLSQTLILWRGRGLPGVFLPGTAIRILCGVIVLFGIVRNIPVYPFNLLAPGGMLHL